MTLRDVTITGGTAEQREVARLELLRFAANVGHDRVQLRSLTLEPFPEGSDELGAYSSDKRIRVDDGLPSLHLLRRVLRHELCHAVDGQDRLVRAAPAGLLTSPAFAELAAINEVRKEGEVLARLCEAGPEALWQVSARCDSEPVAYSEAATWLLEEVYQNWEPLSPVETTVHGVERAALPVPATDLGFVAGTTDEDVLLVHIADPTPAYVYVDTDLRRSLDGWVEPMEAPPEEVQVLDPMDGHGLVLGDRVVAVGAPLSLIPNEVRAFEVDPEGGIHAATDACVGSGRLIASGDALVLRVVDLVDGAIEWREISLAD